jgi:hypothetical protein
MTEGQKVVRSYFIVHGEVKLQNLEAVELIVCVG